MNLGCRKYQVAEGPAQCRSSYYVAFIVRYWAGCVTDSDNTGGHGVYGGIGTWVTKCCWKTWREVVT